MQTPEVSVIMPVYNSAAYLEQAIDSVLKQTFTDFELIIIDDGSVDNSEQIILSYDDKRIIYLKNDRNKGLVYTLNKGLIAAKGKYIARMDGDDVAMPQRLEKQLAYFSKNPYVQILATTVILIDESSQSIGFWEEDKSTISPEQIRSQLSIDNCIVHPSIFCKADLIKKYRYSSFQSQAEDYDLWLRLQADSIRIYKLDEVLVEHRILKNSFTRNRQRNIFIKNAKTKIKFVYQQLRKRNLNFFIVKTFFYACVDILKGILKEIKKIFLQPNGKKLAI